MSKNPVERSQISELAFIGFGEAAQAFWAGWKTAGLNQARAFDIATDDNSRRAAKLQDYSKSGIAGVLSLKEAVSGIDAVFSLVTADQANQAARSASVALPKGSLWFDCNSCSPQTKQKNAELIEASGGRYVDVAVMAPVHPKLHRTPLLISGRHNEAALAVLNFLEMDAKPVSDQVGAASSIKLCRSIMIKGLEALSAECVLSARTLGVEDTVIATLEKTFPGFGWNKRTAHMMERSMVHGKRRAAEMLETASMIEALGLPAHMSRSSAAWQQMLGDLESPASRDDLAANADTILASLLADIKSTNDPELSGSLNQINQRRNSDDD